MKNSVKIILLVVVAVAALVVASFATGKSEVETITMDEFNNLIKKEALVYYGPEQDGSVIKDVAEKNNVSISLLDSTKDEGKNDNLEVGSLYLYKNGKEVDKYRGNLNSYKLAETLMKNGFMEKNYLTVSLSEYKDLIKAEGYHFMFIGRETCGYCTQFKESIKEAMKDYDFMVYYIDTDTFESEDDFNSLVATDSYMSENEWGTPLNLLYKDGKRVNVLNGYVDATELVEFLKENKVVS